ncbi:hypothetical protein [Nocardia arthritidis]|uniref:hypothetical protein n=1 Tax=Nocardia arthritidis TaxID=228602 RepID=UPI001EEA35BA|nr:hypothetical protein [Nocardia arthritidis]
MSGSAAAESPAPEPTTPLLPQAAESAVSESVSREPVVPEPGAVGSAASQSAASESPSPEPTTPLLPQVSESANREWWAEPVAPNPTLLVPDPMPVYPSYPPPGPTRPESTFADRPNPTLVDGVLLDAIGADPGSLAAADSPTVSLEKSDVSRGRIQVQEAGITQPRPPTLAESRARDKARKRAEEARLAAEAAAEGKRRNRKRAMIGGAAIVGVAALVGGGYLAYRTATAPDYENVTAYCTKLEGDQKTVVPDSDPHCGPGHPGFVDDSNGFVPFPLIVPIGSPQYRYYYGGTGTVGKPPTGGTFDRPSNAHITTKSGTTIQRGGLGSKSGGGS